MLHDLIKQATRNLEPEVNTAEDWFGFGKPVDFDEECEDAEFIELEDEDDYEECDCEDDDDDDEDEDDY